MPTPGLRVDPFFCLFTVVAPSFGKLRFAEFIELILLVASM
jgi:hypothetical protein